MSKSYDDMTKAELERELEHLLDNLVDTELLRGSVLGQTGNHVSGGYVNKFEHELKTINENIAAVKKALAVKN